MDQNRHEVQPREVRCSILSRRPQTAFPVGFDELFSVTALLSSFSSSSTGDANEEQQLRSTVYGILRVLVRRQIDTNELNALLSAISTSKNVLVQELLDFLLSFLDLRSPANQPVIELFSQSNVLEELYSLLAERELSVETKELVLKILRFVTDAKDVPEQVQARLRSETNRIGFVGIISGIPIEELNVSIIQGILDLILTSRKFFVDE